eukprot:1152863-Pelagomonas_calceolata.AAC.2
MHGSTHAPQQHGQTRRSRWSGGGPRERRRPPSTGLAASGRARRAHPSSPSDPHGGPWHVCCARNVVTMTAGIQVRCLAASLDQSTPEKGIPPQTCSAKPTKNCPGSSGAWRVAA